MPSIYMPDLLGFVIGVPLFSLPFVVVASDPLLGGVWPLYVLFWIPASFSLVIFVVAARYATSWVRLSDDGLEITQSARLWNCGSPTSRQQGWTLGACRNGSPRR